MRPRNLSKLSCSFADCQPNAITGFPPVLHNGELLSRLENQAWRTLYDNATTHASARHARFSARAEAEDYKPSKDRLEVLLFAKPFRNLVPECDPGIRGNLEAC